MKQRVIILGSTGSVGCNTLDVLLAMRDGWDVVGLAAGSQVDALAGQENQWRPSAVALASEEQVSALDAALAYSPTVFSGENALLDLVANIECDCVVSAVVGTGGLSATLHAVELGRRVALANKEALVIAGSLLMQLAAKNSATIIPVDSEHSAIFQAMHAGRTSDVRRVCLTASGGPFRTYSAEAMERVTVKEALRHPTWNMGPKITIDSATMMNKALEIVEARWLFDLSPDQIEVVVHPESIIHSLVEFCDGSWIAQMSTPDMRTPIQYALTYPERCACPADPLDLTKIHQLNLYPPDMQRFPALRLGDEVARRGGTSGAVLNAANEAAVALFMSGDIRFTEIAIHTQRVLRQHDFKASPTLDDLLAADRWARKEVARCIAC